MILLTEIRQKKIKSGAEERFLSHCNRTKIINNCSNPHASIAKEPLVKTEVHCKNKGSIRWYWKKGGSIKTSLENNISSSSSFY